MEETTPLNPPASHGRNVESSRNPNHARRIVGASLVGALLLLLVLLFHGSMDHDAVSKVWFPQAIVANYSLPITILDASGQTSTETQQQHLFDTSLMECFGFAFDEAQRTAQRLLQQVVHPDNPGDEDDPKEEDCCACPMCHWLVAATHSPYINHPRLSTVSLEQAQRASQRAYKCSRSLMANLDEVDDEDDTTTTTTTTTTTDSPTISRKEHGLIRAMWLRYHNVTAATQTVGYQRYRDALQEMLRDDSNHMGDDDDKDLLAFLADAIMILHCDDEHGYQFYDNENDGEPFPEIQYAMQLLEQCLEVDTENESATSQSLQPQQHPLCQHLYIHITEPSNAHVGQAVTAANGLAAAARTTQAQHLQHMPSHTYLRVGRYHDAVAANREAHASDRAFLDHDRMPYGPGHDLGFWSHAAVLSGERRVAYDAAETLRAHYRRHPDEPDYPNGELGWHIWRTTRLRFGDMEEILQDDENVESIPPRLWPYTQVLGHYTKGIALLATTKETAAAQEELEALQQAMSTNVDDRYRAVAAVANASLSSAVEYSRGNHDAALKLIHMARWEQDGWAYTEPPAWHMTVAGCEATLLLLLGRAKESIELFQQDLENIPENRFSLYGLWKATEESGVADLATLEKLRNQWMEASQWADDKSELSMVPHVCPLYYN